jgi:replicative DNA helicase
MGELALGAAVVVPRNEMRELRLSVADARTYVWVIAGGGDRVSVTELPNRDEAPAGGYGLTPPQDVAAEQSVLGGMMLSKDAIADVVEVLRGHDFYRPAHELIYEAILDLYGRGEPADAVTVAAVLQKQGDLGRIGGAPYLHTLVSSVPSAANAGYYANIVRERAILRRLVEAGTRITQMGYSGDGEADDIVDRAQAEVYAVTERRASEDYVPLGEIMEGALDEIEAIGSRAGEMVGVPTGFADLDSLTNGLHPGQMIILAARPAVGKALALDTPLPTPTGWTTMGEVRVGDMLIGANGKPTQVVAATDVMHGRPCYEVEFSDGSVIVADAQHQWATSNAGVVTTEEMASAAGGHFAVALADSFVCPELIAAAPPPDVRVVESVRRTASVPVRCVEVDASDHLYLAGKSCIPTHNSTLGLDIARAASIKHQLTSVIFSLEMSRNEITMRLLSAEAKVPLHHMRAGQMTDDDWNRIARSTGEVSSAPLYIDDSPNMTMMEIRAKCRRLKQRHDLRIVIVDYLQLMTSGKKVESRQQEVSEFSRSLKLLAKEIEVPVIAICQLNRGPEQRTDKKPMLSDLRESGCVPASTRILRADTGAEVTIGELVATDTRDIPVWSLDDTLRYVPRTMTHAFPSGRKETFRVRMASGKEVDATANHPFLTYEGWKPLGELTAGSRVAVPRHIPAPLVTVPWADAEVIMLGHLIGDGSFVRRQPIRYASVDEENLRVVTEAAKHFGISAVRDDYPAARVTTLRLPAPYRLTHGRRNPIAKWLDGLELFGLRSHEKFVPDGVFSLPKRQVKLFLRHLWATDGSVTVTKNGRSGQIYYSSTSRELVEGVSRLLLRFGISTRLAKPQTKGSYRPQYLLYVSGRDEQLRFLREIGCHGQRGRTCDRLLAILERGTSNTNVDTVPREVWQRVRTLLAEQGMSHRQFAKEIDIAFCGSTLWRHGVSRERLGRVAAVLDDAELEMYATNDILWDKVVSIESLGDQDVFDATVLGTHNFVANGIALHNSLEQDADMVVLLHREDAYEKESPRAGEADFIVAKHRNGPTATITVAFQGHYSRFVDMAQ